MYSKWAVSGVCFLAIFLFGISLITLGSILPDLSTHYQLSEIQKGTLTMILPLGILVGSLFFGPVVDRYSYRGVLSVSILMTIVAFLIITYATKLGHLKVAFLLIGIGGGAINGATSSLISDVSDEHNENKASNLSLLGVFWGLGALGMPLILSLFSNRFDYRTILFGIALGIIPALLYTLFIRYPAPKNSQSISIVFIRNLLKDTTLILLSLILFFQSGWESLVTNWTTTFLTQTHELVGEVALRYLTFYMAVFTLGRLLIGFGLKRYSARSLFYLSTIIALIGSIFLAYTDTGFWRVISYFMMGLGLAAGFPIVLGIIGDRFARWSGTAFSIALSIALGGNMGINYITGWVTESNSSAAISTIIVVVSLFTSILIYYGIQKVYRDRMSAKS